MSAIPAVHLPLFCLPQRARPTLKKPPEFLILENRKKDELRNQVLAEAELVKQLEYKVRATAQAPPAAQGDENSRTNDRTTHFREINLLEMNIP